MMLSGWVKQQEAPILIVEDDEGFAEIIRTILEETGLACEHAPTGSAALTRVQTSPPSLMLLDYSLPDMTGLKLVQTLLDGSQPVPPFIMITGREDTRLAVNIMQHGARDYLVKDVEFLDRLPAVVARARKEAEVELRLKQAEHALRESESRLAKAQQIARMGSWEWNPVTQRIVCSEGIRHLLGLSGDRVRPLTLEQLVRCVHPDDLEQVKAALLALYDCGKAVSMDFRVVREDGSELFVNGQGEVEYHDDGTPHIFSGTLLDITDRKKAENEIQQLAYYDTLTGLPNRALLRDRLSQAIAQAHRDGRLVGVLFLDLDRFKSVNDTLGHLNGDRLLKTVAQRLVSVVRESDTVARIGGDEFVIVLSGMQHEENIGDVAGKILNALCGPVRLDKHELFTTGSIGISIFPIDGEDVNTLLKNADIAMYKAKESDRNNYQFYCKEMNVKIVERLALETSMRKALERSEFSLCYQPQIDLYSGKPVGMEALVRWHHPDLGEIPTETFIPLAEETGLICSIGEWVLRTACARNKAWQDAGLKRLRVAVNLSARQFKQRNLVQMIAQTLKETRLAPEFLELELTESTIMSNAEGAARTLRQLKAMGISLSIDDFGTGYSSLSYLKHFSIDRLKIDRSFVRDICANKDDAAIAEAIIAIAHSLNLQVIAEGVEQRQQLEFLKSRGCDEIQGYLVSYPLSGDSFQPLLSQEIALRL